MNTHTLRVNALDVAGRHIASQQRDSFTPGEDLIKLAGKVEDYLTNGIKPAVSNNSAALVPAASNDAGQNFNIHEAAAEKVLKNIFPDLRAQIAEKLANAEPGDALMVQASVAVAPPEKIVVLSETLKLIVENANL